MSQCRFLLLAAVAAVFVIACSSAENDLSKKIDSLLDKKGYYEAQELIHRSLQSNPKSKVILRKQVELFVRSEQPEYAAAAYHKLQEVNPKDKVLEQLLKYPSTNVRVTAVKTIGFVHAEYMVDSLISALEDKEQSVCQAAIVALGDTKSEKALPFLTKSLKDSRWVIRAEAAQALGKLGNAKAANELFSLLQDSDKYVRDNVRDALQNLLNAENKSIYIQALQNPDSAIRLMAALSLARNGDPSGLDILNGSYDKATPSDQFEIVKTLANSKQTGAIPTLKKGLKHANPGVKINAIIGLGRLADKDSVSELKAIMEDRSEQSPIRLAAQQALDLISRNNP